MKRKIISLVAISLFAANVFSLEFSAVISDCTDFKMQGMDDDKLLDQSEMFTGQAKIPLGDSAYIAAEGSVKHKYEATLEEGGKKESSIILDCTLLKLGTTIKMDGGKNVQLAAGRMIVSDATGIIFSQPNDCVLLKFSSPRFEAAASGGYTGLQNIKNVSILTSSGEQFSLSEEKKLYDFSAPYLTATASISAPYIFLNQTISIEAMGFFDSDGKSELPEDENDRLYGTVVLNGPLAPQLFYSLSGTAQTTQDFEDYGFLGKFALSFFVPNKDAMVGLSAVYASGDKGGLSPFTGFSSNAACYSADEPEYTSLMKFRASAMGMATSQLSISGSADAVFTLGETTEYYGLQLMAGLNFQVFSDLKVSLAGSTFLAKEEASKRTEFVLGASLAF